MSKKKSDFSSPLKVHNIVCDGIVTKLKWRRIDRYVYRFYFYKNTSLKQPLLEYLKIEDIIITNEGQTYIDGVFEDFFIDYLKESVI